MLTRPALESVCTSLQQLLKLLRMSIKASKSLLIKSNECLKVPVPGVFFVMRKAVFRKKIRKNEAECRLKPTVFKSFNRYLVCYVFENQKVVFFVDLGFSTVIFKNVLSIPQKLVHLCNVIGKQWLSMQDPKS